MGCKNLKLRGELGAGNTDVEVVTEEACPPMGLGEVMEAVSAGRGEKSKEKIGLV